MSPRQAIFTHRKWCPSSFSSLLSDLSSAKYWNVSMGWGQRGGPVYKITGGGEGGERRQMVMETIIKPPKAFLGRETLLGLWPLLPARKGSQAQTPNRQEKPVQSGVRACSLRSLHLCLPAAKFKLPLWHLLLGSQVLGCEPGGDWGTHCWASQGDQPSWGAACLLFLSWKDLCCALTWWGGRGKEKRCVCPLRQDGRSVAARDGRGRGEERLHFARVLLHSFSLCRPLVRALIP